MEYEKTSPGFKDPGHPDQYEYYLKRGNRFFFRNSFGKVSVKATELTEPMKELKRGQKVILKF
jgi:hypothetical protein